VVPLAMVRPVRAAVGYQAVDQQHEDRTADGQEPCADGEEFRESLTEEQAADPAIVGESADIGIVRLEVEDQAEAQTIERLRMENALLKKYHTELRKSFLAKRNIGSSITTEKTTK